VLGDYRDTWHATGPAGRRFLTGGVLYAIRLLTFTVAFPLFAKARGFDSGDIGWLVGGASLSLFVFGVPVTMLGARGHTRLLLIAGPILGVVGQATILAAPEGGFALTFLGSLLSGMVSTMFWILGDPLLAATTPPSRRAHVFALKFSLFTAGIALGGGLGGWIPAGLESFAGFTEERALAATMIVVALLDVAQIVAYALIPAGAVPRPAARMRGLARRVGRPRVRAAWLLLLLLAIPEAGMAVGHNSIRPFLPLFFEEQYGLSTGVIGTVMATLALAGGVGALFLPGIAWRVGNLRTIGLFRAFAACMILLCFTGVGIGLVVGFLFAYYAVADGTEATFITEAMERVPGDRRTAFSGLYAMIWSAASFAAAAASGAIQDRPGAGFGAAFALGVVGYTFSVAWIATVFPRLPQSRAAQPDAAASVEPTPDPAAEDFAIVRD
jgi:predicted MFS family arabinose efflux permease